ncbi:MAG: hypothetical protein R3220_06690 [Balneolaceae bacterium]|nr:hypothetical protein [Balneolaceae bacterium]
MPPEYTIVKLEETLLKIRNTDPATGRKIMTNYNDFIDTLNRMIKVQPVSEHVGKAAFYYHKHNKFFEKNSLFNARCEIKENNISDEDLRTTNMQDYITGNILTLSGIEQRLTELGWKG